MLAPGGTKVRFVATCCQHSSINHHKVTESIFVLVNKMRSVQSSTSPWAWLLAGLAVLTLVPLSACQPPASQAPSQMGSGAEVKPGVSLTSQPKNSAELTKLRDNELVPLVEKGKISADEARAFMRAQKKRLNMPNPDKTKALDQILKQKGLN